MRQRPASFRTALRAQWLCAAADRLLGLDNLSAVPALLSGFGSVLDHPAMGRFAQAATALRLLGVSAGSDIHLRQAVQDALSWEDDHRDDDDYGEPPYAIDPLRRNLPFRLRQGADAAVDAMVGILLSPLPRSTRTLALADTAGPMAVRHGGSEDGTRISVDLSGLAALPPPPSHDLGTPPRGPISVTFDELLATARSMDARDRAVPGRGPGNWEGRLQEEGGARKFEMLVPDRAAGAMVPVSTLRFEGVKHLIGLPGTGKTTIIVILLVLLDSRGYRVAVLLPSIEASLNLLGDLEHYGADVGLLVGQSPQTRIRHARKMAERLGADETRGMGRSAPGAELLGLNCALAGFDEDPEAHDGFPHLDPPCASVRQRRAGGGKAAEREMPHLCPLGSVCGRLKAPRELTSRRIWLGHVLSLDTRIGAHFSEVQARYFEAVAMASDLVIVDEADGAQAALDGKAIAALDLTGSVGSYDHVLHRDLFLPMAAGRNDATAANVQGYRATAAEFGKLNNHLVVHLQRSIKRNGTEGVLSRFRDTFVTGSNVLAELFAPDSNTRLPPARRLAEDRRLNALQAFWDGCVRGALFSRTERDDDNEYDAGRIAADLGVDPGVLVPAGGELTDRLRDWLSEPIPTVRDRLLDEAREVLFRVARPRDGYGPEERAELFRFLTEVTALVFQFLSLVPAQQAMVAEGVHRESLFQDSISEDLARVVPEALLGRLSGIRYHQEDAGGRATLRVQYVTFRGAPRVLLYRLHHLFRHDGGTAGPAVVLASATSFLEESPSYHIPVGPDIVLRRPGSDAGWRGSVYRFEPIPDPGNPSARLRFSGAPLGKRERILRQMADHYFGGESPLAVRMTRDFDPGRRVAFVVNGYEHVRWFKDHLRRAYPALAEKVIGVVDTPPVGNAGDWVTAAQVERLGAREDWSAIVFPMRSLARGVNIVFDGGPRRRDALIGTVVFLTRPHPASESLDLVAGIAGASTQAFDARELPAAGGPDGLYREWSLARRGLSSTVRRLLRFPLMASRLGPLAEPFTADIMVDVLQTIGRAMRNGCKARVVFADAAWAPGSAAGGHDDAGSSMLVRMRDILRRRLSGPDPIEREIYRALYEPFLVPLEACAGLSTSERTDDDDE